MGLATLISTNGNACIKVANANGVRISGVLLQAGTTHTDSLLKWGNSGFAGTESNPGVMSDVHARVGGPGKDEQAEFFASKMVQINSGNVIVDDTWLWRADHSETGLIKDSKNPVDTGLQINGDNVIGYGLACEHTLGNMLEWNGDKGRSYFYQSEFPYDVTQENYGDKKFAAYKVADNVTSHEAYGIGAYTFMRDYECDIESGIQAPETDGVQFTNSLSVWLNGKGKISHVINE